MKHFIFLLLILLPRVSLSQSVTGEAELYDLYRKADKELNSVYTKLKKQLIGTDRENLIKAQKAWIKFRDLNCKFKSQDADDGGGVINNKMKLDCLIESTEQRAKELKNLIEGL